MTENNQTIQVTGRDGMIGWIDRKEQPADTNEVLIRLSNGQAILAPADLLQRQPDGSYHLPIEAGRFAEQRDQETADDEVMVIPVIAERALVGKKLIKNRVRVTKRVRERQERIETPGFSEELDIKHVPVNQVVEDIPSVRQEGETTIIPLLEEVLVVEKRILLKEEVHVTLKRQPHEPKVVSLRYEEVEIERTRGDGNQVEPVEKRRENLPPH